MSRETLKDAQFRTIGFIDFDASGKQTARDSRFKVVGYYDPRTNSTSDAGFRRVSTGNTLAALIRCG